MVGRSVELVVDGFPNEIDAKDHDGGAKTGSGVAELTRHHRVLPPETWNLGVLNRRCLSEISSNSAVATP